ncbi:hypothetical protein [Solicola sp. PLA-1-18]|uniref:hypothetical protein n=1 Tax=Solicola sp. PLA-1-18 TaxID=3380532 RepID=UPI003B766A0C
MRRRGALTTVLLAAVAVGTSTPASADDAVPVTDGVHTVAGIVDGLRDDPVMVHQTMASGDTAGAYRRLSALTAQVRQETGIPAYVALVNAPDDALSDAPAKDLGVILPRRLGDGIYVVATPDGVTSVTQRGTGLDDTLLALGRDRVEDAVLQDDRGLLPPVVDADLTLRLVRSEDPRLRDGTPRGDDQDDWYATLPAAQVGELRDLYAQSRDPASVDEAAYEDEVEPASTGTLTVWGVTSGFLAFLLVLTTLLRRWPFTRGLAPALRRRRTADATTAVDPAALRTELDDDLTTLAERIAAAPAGPRHPDALERAVAAREAADALVGTDDERDLVGAVTLVRAGLHDARAATRRDGAPLRTCFLHPLHGEATREAAVAVDATNLDVPVCDACAHDLAAGARPDTYRPARTGRDRPYYEHDDVWASTGYGSLDADYAHTVLRERAARR